MNHIDVSNVLRQTLACNLYSNLVTRDTGAAVRLQIEYLLGESHDRGSALTVIDFSHVSMIDFSCADEVVAKLLMRYASDDPPQDARRDEQDARFDSLQGSFEFAHTEGCGAAIRHGCQLSVRFRIGES